MSKKDWRELAEYRKAKAEGRLLLVPDAEPERKARVDALFDDVCVHVCRWAGTVDEEALLDICVGCPLQKMSLMAQGR